MSDKNKKSMSKKVIGKIEPEKLPGREPEQLKYLQWIIGGIAIILAIAIINALAVEFLGMESLL